ncbi:cupredoxin domain-containing protein [Enterobacter hormaechei]
MRRHRRAARVCLRRSGSRYSAGQSTVNDKQCEPMTITVNSGKTQVILQNHSQKALEWEILKGVMVVKSARISRRASARR